MTNEERHIAVLNRMLESMDVYDSIQPTTERKKAIKAAIKALEQHPCEDEYIKVPKKALKYRTAGMVAYNAEWLKKHWQMELKVMGIECDDAISCEAVIEWLKAKDIIKLSSQEETARKELKALPPVTPQQKYGKWIGHPEIETSAPEYLMFYECSECGDKPCFCKSDIHKKRFCSNCGCHMVKPQESEG